MHSRKVLHASILVLMGFFRKALFFFTGLLTAVALAESAVPTVYRVIRASPNDFVWALRTPLVRPAPERPSAARHLEGSAAARFEHASRLARFFRIKSKRVEGSRIHIEFLPEIPMLSSYFPDTTTVRVDLVETGQSENSFDFDARIEALNDNYLKTTLHVEPHPEGSLLKFQLKSSSYSTVAIKVFASVAESLGFVSSKADATPTPASLPSPPKPAQH